jgi:hypothetical protein
MIIGLATSHLKAKLDPLLAGQKVPLIVLFYELLILWKIMDYHIFQIVHLQHFVHSKFGYVLKILAHITILSAAVFVIGEQRVLSYVSIRIFHRVIAFRGTI